MAKLTANENVVTKDIIIYFKNSYPTSCRGDKYNIPVGTLVKNTINGSRGKIVWRKITDIGVKYDIKTSDGSVIEAYEKSIEILEEKRQDMPDRCRINLKNWQETEIAPAAFYAAFPDVFVGADTKWFNGGIDDGYFLFHTGDQYSIIGFCPDCGKKLDYMEWIKDLWAGFGDIPMEPVSECLEEAFLEFPSYTSRYDIWEWFEETFGISVATDLMGQGGF